MTTDNQSCTNDHLYSLAYFATRLLTWMNCCFLWFFANKRTKLAAWWHYSLDGGLKRSFVWITVWSLSNSYYWDGWWSVSTSYCQSKFFHSSSCLTNQSLKAYLFHCTTVYFSSVLASPRDNIVGQISEVDWRWAAWLFTGVPLLYSTKPLEPTQPGHPSMGMQNEYQWWLRFFAKEETVSFS